MSANAGDVPRTVLRTIQLDDMMGDETKVLIELQTAIGMVAGINKPKVLDVPADEATLQALSSGPLKPEVVKRAGRFLFDRLVAHDSSVAKDAIEEALNLAVALGKKPGQFAPLYIKVDSDLADRLPWEILCGDDGFLALDPRWPIGRIVSTPMEGVSERSLELPLRFMVVLAAAGISARPEWDAIHQAILTTREKAPHLDLQMKVVVCEADLAADITNLNDPAIVDVELSASVAELADSAASFSPHLLHFFCHGSTEDGTFLVLASRNDWDQGATDGSMLVAPNDFMGIPGIDQRLWLVTLNCCLGAAGPAAGEGWSFGRALVGMGVPAVVAMREVVKNDVAHDFAAAFYPALLQELAQCVQSADAVSEVHWAKALNRPRRELCEKRKDAGMHLTKAATELKEWTLPVLYVAPERFKVRRLAAAPPPAPAPPSDAAPPPKITIPSFGLPPTAPETPAPAPALDERERLRRQVTIDVLRTQRAQFEMLPGTPPALLAELDAKIVELEAELVAAGAP